MVFKCDFEFISFFISINYPDLNARIGNSPNIGNFGQAYFDHMYKIWIIVESIAGGQLPSSLTTILNDGTAFHSNHTIWSPGVIKANQGQGKCLLFLP